MASKPPDPKTGLTGRQQKADPDLVERSREGLPKLIRESQLFDLDYDPPELARMAQIIQHLPDQTVVDVSGRLQALGAEKQPDFALFSKQYGISPAERKLLESLVAGLTVVAHAGKEEISVNTARTHMRRLLDKTGSSGQLDLMRKVRDKV
jgi:DNA-binding CsgD family transcriptional regulator